MVHNAKKATRKLNRAVSVGILMGAMGLLPNALHAQQSGQRTFSSAGEATKALMAALKSNDESSLLGILGPDAKDIVSSGDPVEDKNRRQQMVEKYQQMHRLVTEPDGKTTLYIGAENWPTPIPLIHKGDSWYFDTAEGKQEILYRRIGRNETEVIQICRELVDAEKEYYSKAHDGAAGSEYAQKLFSDPGKHNGLYWQASAGEGESPIGPLMASASADGYASDHQPEPFHGYYFRVLTGQKAGKHAKTESFIVDGKMTRGFAFLAYPSDYRSTGVMTFMVDQDGVVYEKDLGKRTAEAAKSLTAYDRDGSWRKAE
ncbi:MAG TPA: DUF2950 domain-containing protein [Candidatus Binatia bacterium]|nr:DUF2950 domain-containing protein [Candidatus Binatia bacterium]